MKIKKINFNWDNYPVNLELVSKTKGVVTDENHFSGLPVMDKNTYGALLLQGTLQGTYDRQGNKTDNNESLRAIYIFPIEYHLLNVQPEGKRGELLRWKEAKCPGFKLWSHALEVQFTDVIHDTDTQGVFDLRIMAGMYDLVKDVFLCTQTWRLKVRIVKIWEMCPIDQPANPFAIEMVMMDIEGAKIQATIRKPMIRKFRGSVLEGHAYKMAFFGVVRNTDMMGLLTAASSEKSGRMTRGKINCTFFGDYVDVVNGYLARESKELPVVVVQYARVKAYKGVVSIQNVMNTTTIMWNPDIPEAIEFKRSLAEHGFETEVAVGAIGEAHNDLSMKDDFLGFYPRKIINELHMTEEEGNFIVIATVAAILGDDAWRYSACSCMKAVNEEDGVFFCPVCKANVKEVTPRFKLKIEVFDGDDTTAFILFDQDAQFLLGKTCPEFVTEAKDPEFGEIPDEFQLLVGKEMLFKVDKGPEYAFRFDDTFRVRRICVDPEIMKMFKESVVITTPEKNKFVPPFPTLEEASSSGTVKGADKEVVNLCGEVQLVSRGLIEGGGGDTISENEGKSNAESFLAVDPVVAPFAMTDVVDLESQGYGDVIVVQSEKPLVDEFNLKKKKNMRLKKVKIERE
ncbi:hypothetical protein SESBI_19834 [Sesbania bispinosa]|nr:hypothetical protein SESBI_19834 [Sesbania bispinosa]